MRAEVGFRRWESDRSAGNLIGVLLALLGLATLDLIFLFPALIAMVGRVLRPVRRLPGLSSVGGTFLLVNLLVGGWHHPLGNAADAAARRASA